MNRLLLLLLLVPATAMAQQNYSPDSLMALLPKTNKPDKFRVNLLNKIGSLTLREAQTALLLLPKILTSLKNLIKPGQLTGKLTHRA